MEKENRKALITEFKDRKNVGGIYGIINDVSGIRHIYSTPNIEGSKNRFEFAMKTGSCIIPQRQNEWEEFGSTAFHFEKLEELEKGNEQTSRSFADDLKLLLEMWTK